MKGIFGTPPLDTVDIIDGLDSLVSFHGIAHLFSSVLIDTEKLRTGSTIALVMDVGPDGMFMTAKNHYCAGVFTDGELIEVIQSASGRVVSFEFLFL